MDRVRVVGLSLADRVVVRVGVTAAQSLRLQGLAVDHASVNFDFMNRRHHQAVRLCFPELHGLQAGARFPTECVPPRELGMMWSQVMVASSGGFRQ